MTHMQPEEEDWLAESKRRMRSMQTDFQNAKDQILASAGNMGDESPAMPDSLRDKPLQTVGLVIRYLPENQCEGESIPLPNPQKEDR